MKLLERVALLVVVVVLVLLLLDRRARDRDSEAALRAARDTVVAATLQARAANASAAAFARLADSWADSYRVARQQVRLVRVPVPRPTTIDTVVAGTAAAAPDSAWAAVVAGDSTPHLIPAEVAHVVLACDKKVPVDSTARASCAAAAKAESLRAESLQKVVDELSRRPGPTRGILAGVGIGAVLVSVLSHLF